MISKKNRDFDLERLRTPLRFLGLLFASAVALAMLEWRVPDKPPKPSDYGGPELIPDEVVFTAIPERPNERLEPPKPKVEDIRDRIVLIEDGEKIRPHNIDTREEPKVIAIAKKPEIVTEEEVPYPDVMPEFPGGLGALHAYLQSELQYPSRAKSANIQEKVWIEFLVDKKGEISDVKVVRGIGGGCDKEALRVVLQMPRWKPGLQHGHPVNVRYHLPISFVLRN